MIILHLVDVSDYEKTCGFLVCDNDNISCDLIQNKVNEIKSEMDEEGVDWMVDDVIKNIPTEWRVKLYSNEDIVRI